MPSIQQIVSYSLLFRCLRGRKPTTNEVRRYFEGEPKAFAPASHGPSRPALPSSHCERQPA